MKSAHPAPSTLGPGKVTAAATLLMVALTVGVLVGPVRMQPWSVLSELASHLPFASVSSELPPNQGAIVWQIRFPRVLLGAMVGAMLALCGAAYQGVFRNPLADPYLLGAAAGAGLGATAAVAFGPSIGSAGSGLIPVAAFAGAVLGVTAAYSLGRAAGGRTSASLVLAGVAVSSFLTAIQTYLQQSRSDTLREVYSWILGGLGSAGWRQVWLMFPYAVVAAAVILMHRRLLEVLSVGEEEAGGLGIKPARVRLTIVAAASLGTAAAVSVSGLIGFVGIIVPHTIRLIVGPSNRVVLPLCIAGGAAFMVLADVLARSIAAPAEIPIGVVTAFFGAPFFASLLRRSRGAV